MAHGILKDLPRRTASDKVIRDKFFNIAKILILIVIKQDLHQWFTNFFYKKLLLTQK